MKTVLICFLQPYVNFESHPWILFVLPIILEILNYSDGT